MEPVEPAPVLVGVEYDYLTVTSEFINCGPRCNQQAECPEGYIVDNTGYKFVELDTSDPTAERPLGFAGRTPEIIVHNIGLLGNPPTRFTVSAYNNSPPGNGLGAKLQVTVYCRSADATLIYE